MSGGWFLRLMLEIRKIGPLILKLLEYLTVISTILIKIERHFMFYKDFISELFQWSSNLIYLTYSNIEVLSLYTYHCTTFPTVFQITWYLTAGWKLMVFFTSFINRINILTGVCLWLFTDVANESGVKSLPGANIQPKPPTTTVSVRPLSLITGPNPLWIPPPPPLLPRYTLPVFKFHAHTLLKTIYHFLLICWRASFSN